MYSDLKKGLFLVTFSGAAMMCPITAHGADTQDKEPRIGIEEVLDSCIASEKDITIENYLVPGKKGKYLDMAFADVETFLYIRSEPTTRCDWVGKLYPNDAAQIMGPVGEWTKVRSGKVTGYVYSKYITVGKKAEETAQEIKKKSKEKKSEKKEPEKEKPEKESLASNEPAAETAGADAAENELEQFFEFAESKEDEEKRLEKEAEEKKKKEEEEAKEKAGSGQAVVDYACQFIGNPYVWGGTSLTNGADCSGFVQSVYKHFGVNLPRTSGAMRGSGKGVSYSDAIPGDIVCYSGHVGIYMGNGKIVNAINSSKGIGVLSATYANIVTVRRVL